MDYGLLKTLTFTRSQLAELSRVGDGVLSFWLKNDVVKPIASGLGRGAHRRFSAYSVTIASILGSLQPYALKLASLRSFSELLYSAVELCSETNLHPWSISTAGQLARDIHRFRSGEKFQCYIYRYDDEKNEYDVSVEMPQTESDLFGDISHMWSDYDPAEKIINFAKTLGPVDYQLTEIFAEISVEMFGLETGDTAWLLWQDREAHWRISRQSEPNDRFIGFPESETAIFIAVGKIISRVWNIDLEAKKEARAYKIQFAREQRERARAYRD